MESGGLIFFITTLHLMREGGLYLLFCNVYKLNHLVPFLLCFLYDEKMNFWSNGFLGELVKTSTVIKQ